VNLKKTQVLVFSKSGRALKSEKFSWRKVPISGTKEYTYLGVTFSSTGRFLAHAASAVSKGHAATAALMSILKFPRNFSLPSTKKLLTSTLLSITLYGAGIWGLTHSEQLEATQQRFLKRVIGLPITTPKYFLRLEAGIPHVSLTVAKLAYSFWLRILSAKEGSLIKAGYEDLRKAAASPSGQVGENWCLQLGELLDSVDLKSIYNLNSYNYAKSHFKIFLAKFRAKLGESDVHSAKASSTMPHYHSLIKSDYGAKFYMKSSLPRYAVRRIAQVRLGRNTVLNCGAWVKLGDFSQQNCKFCGDELSFYHVLDVCTNFGTERQMLSRQFNSGSGPEEKIFKQFSAKLQPLPTYKALHIFLCNSISKFE
jgi:hypothetical protein